ncbi:MAG: right-handed parallel beta-helix repeat-containing protein [Thermoplasmatales archaeon]|nr:MAG: right-handed parallel beta-helix repeat-containing protein [Thermoplasmatales archaeon]
MNDKKYLTVAAILFFISLSVVSSSGTTAIKHSIMPNFYGNTLYVGGDGPGNYSRIQDAIDNASDGITVFVYNGTYYENILINKQIVLKGENKYNTTINGLRNDDTVTITSAKVIVTRFKITNSSNDIESAWWKAGIRVIGSHITIDDNIISDNLLGIFCKQVKNLTIVNNIFENDGLNFYPYDGENLRPPLIIEHFIHTIQNNTVNGKPLLYYANQEDFEVPSNVGQLIAVNCTKMKIRNSSFSNTDFMVLMVFCSDCIIENSTFMNNDGVFSLLASDNNTIEFNNMSNNLHGILLDYYSKNNRIHHNHISNNIYCGAICEYLSNWNQIYCNNFINNQKNAHFILLSLYNKWHANYWDKPRVLPHLITGVPGLFITCWFNIDWYPAQEPYDI